MLFWLLEVSVVNSYIVQKPISQRGGKQPLSHLQYSCSFILSLFSRRLSLPQQPRPGRQVDPSLEQLQSIPHFSERRRDCRVCSRSGHHRTTAFFCRTCSDRPHLHPGQCFCIYHTRVNSTVASFQTLPHLPMCMFLQ